MKERRQERERERERERESSLNKSLSKDNPDIFEEGIFSQRCVGISYSCSQNLGKQVNETF